MNKITVFDKQNLPEIHKEITAALATVSAKYGLQSIQLGSISYDATSFKAQLVAQVDPSASPAAQLKNKSNSELLGYSDNIVGLKFTNAGQVYEITGIDLKRPKYPINADGPLSPQFVLEMMGFPPNWTELPYLTGASSHLWEEATP